jgi:hypothetical protein
VVSALEELVERLRDLAVDAGRVTDEPEPQVVPTWAKGSPVLRIPREAKGTLSRAFRSSGARI